jgi:hypothetical protein
LLKDERCTYNMNTMEKEVIIMFVNLGSVVFFEPLYKKCGSTTSNSSSQ